MTLPILFAALAGWLGLDVALALTLRYVFMMFTDPAGQSHNLESVIRHELHTAEHYRILLHITDAALESGIYLHPLSHRETLAVVAVSLDKHLVWQGALRRDPRGR